MQGFALYISLNSPYLLKSERYGWIGSTDFKQREGEY